MMPIYEYRCQKCGSQVEVMQKIGDAPPKRCGKCRGKLEKVVSRTSFQLKGSGWYKTDYSSKDSAATRDKAEKSPEKKSDSPAKPTPAKDSD
jgi:putative FmdB family regulatory protein